MINVSCSDGSAARGGGGGRVVPSILLYLAMAILPHPLFPRILNSWGGLAHRGVGSPEPAHEHLTLRAWRAETTQSCFTIRCLDSLKRHQPPMLVFHMLTEL